jgi:hypothetical protein
MKILAQLTVPLVVNKNKIKIKPFFINLNNFIQISKCPPLRNQIKQRYSDLIAPKLSDLKPIEGTIKIIYVIHGKDARKFDVGNVGAVLDKFFCDCLVKNGILQDDNYDFIKRVEFIWGGICRKNPTADVFILKNEAEEYKDYLRVEK